MYKITCYCDTEIETEIEDVFDISREPSIIDEIVDGRFLNFTCPNCGKILKPELTIRFKDEGRFFDLYFIPEAERNSFLAGTFAEVPRPNDCSGTLAEPDTEPSAGGYTVVIGYPELAERMLLLRLNLDPGVMEIIKYFYLRKIQSPGNIKIYFDHSDDDKLYFHIHGLKQDEIGVAGIPQTFYDRIVRELSASEIKPEYAEIIAAPYISVNKIVLDIDADEGAHEE